MSRELTNTIYKFIERNHLLSFSKQSQSGIAAGRKDRQRNWNKKSPRGHSAILPFRRGSRYQTTGMGVDELQISPADPRGSPGKEQQAAGVGILLQIMMLVLSFVLGHVLRRHKFYYLPEASASLLIGRILPLLVFGVSFPLIVIVRL